MELTVYTITLAVAAVITAVVTALARTGGGTKTPATRDFRTFQYGYLLIYYIAMTADWLQGPYVYALYSSYGFSKHDIAVLFVGGFGSSMVFGTFAGAAADRLGRKRACQLYCVLYILSCATKHAHDYNILMIGRITGGIATSLLFSAFESWMVCEHNARGYDGGSLSDTFSLMYFGNSLCAIGAGMLAEAGADAVALTPFAGQRKWHYGGYCTPFDFSAAFLVVGLVLITCLWGENYGSSPSSSGGRSDCMSSFKGPLAMLFTDKRLVLCGLVVSLFEGSMYIFVFNWCAPPPAQFGAIRRAIPRSSAQFAAQFAAHVGALLRPEPHASLAQDACLLRRRRDAAAIWAHLRDVHGGVHGRLVVLRARLRPDLVRGAAAQRLRRRRRRALAPAVLVADRRPPHLVPRLRGGRRRVLAGDRHDQVTRRPRGGARDDL